MMDEFYKALGDISAESNASVDMQSIARNIYAITSLIYNLKVKHNRTEFGRPFSILFTKCEELLALAALYDGMLSDEFKLENSLEEILREVENGDITSGTEAQDGVDPSRN